MATYFTVKDNGFGEYDNLLKSFTEVVSLDNVEIPFNLKNDLIINLNSDAEYVVNFNSLSNAHAVIIYSSQPIRVRFSDPLGVGGFEDSSHVCDPVIISTNKSDIAGAYTKLALTRTPGVDTMVMVSLYQDGVGVASGTPSPIGTWKVFYSDGNGDVQPLSLGLAGTFLKSTGVDSAPEFSTVAISDIDGINISGASQNDLLQYDTGAWTNKPGQLLGPSDSPTFVGVSATKIFHNTSYTPTGLEPIGTRYWDKESQTTTLVLPNGVKLQDGEEIHILVKNMTGSLIPNGSVVYPVGSSGQAVLIDLADCNFYEKSRPIAMVTEDIADGATGRVTRIGEVRGLNTSAFTANTVLYLSPTTPGGYTATKPTGGAFPIVIGAVKKVGVTDGSIVVDPIISEYTVEALQRTGWSREFGNATISFNDGNRTLTLTPTGSKFHFYQDGIKYQKTTDSFQITATEGVHFIYYDAGVLKELVNPNQEQMDVLIRENPLVASVYWNASNNKSEYVGYELHDFNFDPLIHAYNHFAFGTRYLTGLAPNTISADASGNLATSAQFGVDSGAIADEDIYLSFPGVASTVGLTIAYLSGPQATPVLRTATNPGYSVLTAGSGRLAYNTISGGNYITAEVDDNNFVLCHLLAINENTPTKRVIAIMGQAQYNTIAAALDGAQKEILTLRTTGVAPQESKVLATFIFETSNTFGNAVKGRIRAVSTGVNYVDWRTTYFNGSSGGAGGSGTGSTTFNDNLFRIFNNTDATKQIALDASGITTGNTRTIIMPDANVNLGLKLESVTTDATLSGSGTAGSPLSVVQSYVTKTGLGANKVFYSNGSGVFTELALGAADTYLKSTGATTAPVWASGGTTTIATQRVWSDIFTVSRTDNDTITYTASTSAIATVVANSIIGRLARWTDSGGTTVRRGFIRNATAASTTVTIELSGNVFASGDTNFRISIYETVKNIDWYIPGEQIGDATNPVGKMYFNRTGQDWRILSTSAYLGTAGVHSGTGVMTYNIYNGANAIFSAAPDLVETAVLDNSLPNQNNPITGGSKITLRTPTVTADTTKPQDLYVIAFYAYDDLWDAV